MESSARTILWWFRAVGPGVNILLWVIASCCLQAQINVVVSVRLSHIFFVCVCAWSQNLNLIFITSESKMLDIMTPFHILKVRCMVLKGLCPRLALFQHYPLAIEPLRFLSAILVFVLTKMLLCHSQGTH